MARCSIVLLIFCGFGCKPDETSQSDRSIWVSACGGSQHAIQDAAAEFTRKTRVTVHLNFGSSNALASQILAGSPTDVFVSANLKWARAVADQGRCETMCDLLRNRLVLIVPKGNPAGVHDPKDLLLPSVRHVALGGKQVPVGIYAQQALKSAGVYDALLESGKIARGHDVRITLNYVAYAEADAGIVFATDAQLTDRVEVVHRFDLLDHEPIIFPVLLIRREGDRSAAQKFYEFLQTEQAGAIFQKYGFETIR